MIAQRHELFRKGKIRLLFGNLRSSAANGFGFPVARQIRLGRVRFFIAFWTQSSMPTRAKTEHVAEPGVVVYFEVENLDQRCRELADAGIVFDQEPRDEPWLWREARLRDPSGNVICLYWAGGNRKNPPWRIATDASAGPPPAS